MYKKARVLRFYCQVSFSSYSISLLLSSLCLFSCVLIIWYICTIVYKMFFGNPVYIVLLCICDNRGIVYFFCVALAVKKTRKVLFSLFFFSSWLFGWAGKCHISFKNGSLSAFFGFSVCSYILRLNILSDLNFFVCLFGRLGCGFVVIRQT